MHSWLTAKVYQAGTAATFQQTGIQHTAVAHSDLPCSVLLIQSNRHAQGNAHKLLQHQQMKSTKQAIRQIQARSPPSPPPAPTTNLQSCYVSVPVDVKELQGGVFSRQHHVAAEGLQHNTRRAAGCSRAAGPVARCCECCCCWWWPQAVYGGLHSHGGCADEPHRVVTLGHTEPAAAQQQGRQVGNAGRRADGGSHLWWLCVSGGFILNVS